MDQMIFNFITSFGLPSGLIGTFVVLLIKGYIIPSNIVKYLQDDRDLWKKNYLEERNRNDVIQDMNKDYYEQMKLSNKLLKSLQEKPIKEEEGYDEENA